VIIIWVKGEQEKLSIPSRK